MIQMKILDRYEKEMLAACEKGALISARPTKAQLDALGEAARATFVMNRRASTRLSAAALTEVQARAYEEGVPYQRLIARVLRRHVSRRMHNKRSPLSNGSKTRTRKRS